VHRKETKKFEVRQRIEHAFRARQNAVAMLHKAAANNGERKMNTMRIVAMPTEVANTVRSTLKAPTYGFPAHVEIAGDAAPNRCRNPAPSTSTLKIASDTTATEVFPKSCVKVRGPSKLTHAAGA
jgi:hypothetical protein